MKVFLLWHTHELTDDFGTHDEEKLIGHYRYYGISFNSRMIANFRQQVRELLFKALNRRSQRKSYTRDGFIEMMKYYPLVNPKIYMSLFD